MTREEWTCPFCGKIAVLGSDDSFRQIETIGLDHEGRELAFERRFVACPSSKCKKLVITVALRRTVRPPTGPMGYSGAIKVWRLVPPSTARPFPDYVPQAIRSDYEEACAILDLSPKASATLARRALQGMIRDFWKITKSRLKDEIDELKNRVDELTWNAIDGLRKVGNIGAHMEKDADVVLDVDPGEAEKLVRLVEVLVDQWYVKRHDHEMQLKAVIDLAEKKEDQRREGQ